MTQRTKDAGMCVFAIVIFLAILGGVTHRAKAATDDELREFMKDVARQRYTEICSAPMPRGEALPKALNEAMVADPATWAPWILWWNDVVSMRKKAGCGDA